MGYCLGKALWLHSPWKSTWYVALPAPWQLVMMLCGFPNISGLAPNTTKKLPKSAHTCNSIEAILKKKRHWWENGLNNKDENRVFCYIHIISKTKEQVLIIFVFILEHFYAHWESKIWLMIYKSVEIIKFYNKSDLSSVTKELSNYRFEIYWFEKRPWKDIRYTFNCFNPDKWINTIVLTNYYLPAVEVVSRQNEEPRISSHHI